MRGMLVQGVLGKVVAAVLVVTALCSCGGKSSERVLPDADDPAFAGLDRALVDEVLTHPVAGPDIVADDSRSVTEMVQWQVLNFWECRAVAAGYREALETGVTPEFPEMPRPDKPVGTGYEERVVEYGTYVELIERGDFDRPRVWLTAEGGCGAWIPAQAGDVNGPTISDTLGEIS